MTESQKRAVANHRQRLKQRGFARYEVRGLAEDKELVRKFAQRLAANDERAGRLRQEVARVVTPQEFRTGKEIWEALRRSPLVGAELNLEREVVAPRVVDL
jgi:hypothetical protein